MWPLLKQGSKGEDVRTTQYLLRARGRQLGVDGAFGPLTDEAVRAFQASQGLVADGVVGPKTWEALVEGGKLSLGARETAMHLYDAWTRQGPGSGRQVATEEAVRTLFSRQWRPEDGWSYDRSDGTAGHLYFVWTRPGEQLGPGVPTPITGDENQVDQVVFQ